MNNPQLDIRIGTLVNGGPNTADYIRQILPHGFESFTITFWQTLGGTDLKKLAAEVREALAGSGAVISAVEIFGNPLEGEAKDIETLQGWEALIDHAHLFGTDIVAALRAGYAASRSPIRYPASKRCSAHWRSARPTKACGSPSRTCRWAATGRPATGTLPTTPRPGS